MEQLLKLRKLKQEQLDTNAQTPATELDLDDHDDIFEELSALLGESDKT